MFEENISSTHQNPRTFWIHYVTQRWALYTFGIFTVLLTNFADVYIPKVQQYASDFFTHQKTPEWLTWHRPQAPQEWHMWFTCAILILLFVQMIGRIFWRLTLARQTHKVASHMKSLIWNRARFLPLERIQTDLSPGELMNVATGDVGSARFIFGFTLVATTDFIFLSILVLSSMLFIDPKLTVACLFYVPFFPFLLDRLSRKEHKTHTEAQEILSQVTQKCSLAVSTIRMQRLTQTFEFWSQQLRELARAYKEKRREVIHTSLSFIPISGVAPLISYAILLTLSLSKLNDGTLSVGQFVAFQSLVFIIQQPLGELGFLVAEWQRAFASLRRFTDTLSQKEHPGLRSGGLTPNEQTTIFHLKNLEFQYPDSQQKIISNVTLDLKKGEHLGILGKVGSGKSTFLRILAGLEHRFQGDLLFYGHDIRTIQHSWLRDQIAFVPQKSFLFADSILKNLGVHKELSEDEAWHILGLVQLADEVRGWPEGLHTSLGEWGINLSGGQKQRLTLARAIARKTPILLLDDCLSAVDTVTEEKILTQLRRELSDRTWVWVAHRASTLKYCDRILEFSVENSYVVER